MKKILVIIFICLILGISLVLLFLNNSSDSTKSLEKDLKEETIIDYKINYSDFVKVNKNSKLYDRDKKEIGSVTENTVIELDDTYEIVDEYYKIKNTDYYIDYLDVEPTEIEVFENNEYKTYKNYIVYNENIKTNSGYKMFLSNDIYYQINNEDTYPIIIKDDSRYGVEFNNHLVYINKEDVKEVYENNNTDLNHTNAIAVLNYHYAIDANSDEAKECVQTICLSETQIDEEIKYLYDNNFYTVNMEDLYLFVTGKIQLPEKSVSITIDDGWYVARMIQILEKYQMMGTLYLIGWLASPSDYASPYLEIHSHTWNLHTPGVCSGEHGGGLLCLDEETILEDLKKSRESLNNTEVLCYPFYEYNNRTIEFVKKAGFKMALGGGQRKAKVGDDLYKIPRYVMLNGTTMNQFMSYVN